MIRKLQLLRNIGPFDSVDAGANIDLTKLTLLYAENGRGKTTIAAILRSLATHDPLPIRERRRLAAINPPHVVLHCDGDQPVAIFQEGNWNRSLDNIVVFDELFVHQNVCSGLEVDPGHRQNLHELILGAHGVSLNRRFVQLADAIEQHNSALRAKSAAIPASARGSMNVDDFCALQARADIAEAIQAAERNLAAVREQDSIRTRSLFESLSLPAFDPEAVDALLRRDMANLDAAAVERVGRHFSELGHGGEEWVAEGMQRMTTRSPVETDQVCPFCAQGLTESLVLNHYRAYFSAEYTDLKRAVVDTLANLNRQHGGDVQVAFERAVRLTGEHRQFWSRFCDLPEVAIDTQVLSRSWRTACDAVTEALQAKQAAPLDCLSLSSDARAAIATYETHRQAVAELSQRLQVGNTAISLVKEQAAGGNATALAADVGHLKAVQARHTPEIVALCTDYLNEKAAKTATELQREQAREALSAHRETSFPAYQTAINEYLRRFNAGFRLTSVAAADTRSGPTCTYSVVINNTEVPVSGRSSAPGEPSFRTTLSAGDRSALALAFFLASLDQDPAIGGKIVVIDDPIASLDDHRELTTVQEIRRLAEQARQVILLSHDKPFLCRIWENADRVTRSALQLTRDGDGSTISPWDVNQDCITEHDRRHSLFREFLEQSGSVDSRTVAKDIRDHLEAFLRVACPEHFAPGTLLGAFRELVQQRLGTPQQILDIDNWRELRDLTEFGNQFHHDTNPAWETATINDSQLVGYVQRTLRFTGPPGRTASATAASEPSEAETVSEVENVSG